MSDITILIVDDDRTMVRLCRHLLERAHYKVISAMSPLEALKILEKHKVDLLLSDIRMPVMDGFEMVTRAKQCQPDLPVLVMTGYGSIENALQALHRGVEGLILKPFENTAELAQAVQRVLAESQQKRDAVRLQALRPLFNITERLLTETSPQALETLILNAVTGLFQASYAGIFQAGAPHMPLEVIRVNDRSAPAGSDINGPFLEFLPELLAKTLENGAPEIVRAHPSGLDEPPDQSRPARLQEIGWETMLAAPVRQNERQFVLCACRAAGSPGFNEADLEMFAILARQAAVAMENARLYSELKDYVRRVEDSQRALVQAEKMAAVGRLMASLAHEINNPLQSVRNCLHLANRSGLSRTQRQRYLEMTDSELERLVSTVQRMLDFYRSGMLENQPVDVCQVIHQVLALTGTQLRALGIQVKVQTFGQPVMVNSVRDQIQQVIFNLLLNAMDALDDSRETSGSLAVDSPTGPPAGPSACQKTIWIDLYYEQDWLRILVEDSGPGIPHEMREQVFEPFVSTKPHGTGLGLAVSYGIMERHQGGLTIVPTRYYNGACFEVRLPIGVM